jgi:hypothetical protein
VQTVVAAAATLERLKRARCEGIGRLLLMMVRQLSAVAVVLVGALVVCSAACAERVGYSFTGWLNPQRGPIPSWFGFPLDGPKYFTGTFSYDTTTPGVDAEPGVRSYPQLIAGGYSLDVEFGTSDIVVQASDYKITVANDFKSNASSPPTDQFYVNYSYATASNLAPQKVLVNGTPWTGDSAFIVLGLSWDQNTFPDPDEPKLTADRPGTPDPGFFGYSSSSSQFFPGTISDFQVLGKISPQAGDYNVDGRVDEMDYIEWRNAVGRMDPYCMYADGNHDGVVDAADYVIWRKTPGGALVSGTVPEPGALSLVASGLVVLVRSRKRWQSDAQQR